MTDRISSTRRETITEKVKTPFGSLFLHVEHQGPRVIGLRIAHPQKLEDTTVGELLEVICDGVTAALKAVPNK